MASKEVINGIMSAREKHVQAIAVLDQALAVLSGEDIVMILDRHINHQDWTGMGITAAAKRFLGEVGAATTREILDAIKARGVTTKSKKESATVYATLTNSKDVKRVGDKWELVNA